MSHLPILSIDCKTRLSPPCLLMPLPSPAMPPLRLPLLALLPLALLATVHADEPKQIRTSRESERILPLPKGEDSFHFIIYGDRTGGPAEGVHILARAVEDTNLLDPDLVMTVGDLVQGYNTQEPWMQQMEEYRGIMNRLRMPWFPVAGNHDIYWRGENRPPTEHETNYEKHFGPLWYWFEHKKSGFLVLFSDEGDPANPEAQRHFGDPAQQKFSATQLAWLRQSLQEMKGLEHIFVFMHHPRWAPDIYPESNWDEVHRLLVENGNVSACFAGHIHKLRYDGVKDGIEYFALAATGGGIPGDYPQVGYLHHCNLVTVRPEGIRVSTLPVGAVIDPKRYTVERGADLTLAMGMAPEIVSRPLPLDETGRGGGVFEMKWTNPSQRPLEFTLTPADALVTANNAEWTVTPDHAHLALAPGESQAVAFHCTRDRPDLPPKVQAPVLILQADYLEEDARATLPPRRVVAPWTFTKLPEQAFAPAAKPSALQLGNGKSAGVRVDAARFDLPDGPFTLETWVYLANPAPSESGIVSKTENSEFGLFSQGGRVSFIVHLDGNYARATAPKTLPLMRWTHVAGVFDGNALVLYLDGEEAARSPAQGKRTRNGLPLYLGADPDGKGNPSRPFLGWVDEIRLSKGVRYAAPFQPERQHAVDAETLLHFPLDRHLSGIVPDHSGSAAHGQITGSAAIKASPGQEP